MLTPDKTGEVVQIGEAKRDLRGLMFDIEDPILDAERCLRGLSLMLTAGAHEGGLDKDDIRAMQYLVHRGEDAVRGVKDHWQGAFNLVVRPDPC